MELSLFSTVSQRDLTKSQQSIFLEAADQVDLAESLGFDIAWFPEHHFTNYSICPNPISMCAFTAARTKRIRLGPAVIVVPLHNPIQVIEELALMDQLSGGRVAIGLGGGYQEFEFHRFGVELAKNRIYFNDFLDIYDQFMRTGSIEFDGALASIPKTSFTLGFIQKNPAVFIASGTSDPEVQSRMVSAGYTTIMSMVCSPLDVMKQKYDASRRVHVACGGDPDDMPFALNQYLYVTQDRDEARRAAEAVLYVFRVHAAMRHKHADLGAALGSCAADGEPTVDELLERLCIGDPETVSERLDHQIRLLQPTHMSFIMGLPGLAAEHTLKSMELFGKLVQPSLFHLASEAKPVHRLAAAGD